MYVNTELELPTARDTVLAFFERVQRQFPSMGSFYRRESNEYCLEEDRRTGRYRWIALETDRVASGIVNPSAFDEAYDQHGLVLKLMPYMLSINHLDVHSLDVSFAMDFEFSGSHDEVIAEALFASTAFDSLLEVGGARPIGFSPAVVMALSEDCCTQARLSVESKTSMCEPMSKSERLDRAITLSFTIRQYPLSTGTFDPIESFERQCRLGEELMEAKIIPNFVRPLTDVIAQKRLT
jgi:hypothetical protein